MMKLIHFHKIEKEHLSGLSDLRSTEFELMVFSRYIRLVFKDYANGYGNLTVWWHGPIQMALETPKYRIFVGKNYEKAK
jgi:hypothetical protein